MIQICAAIVQNKTANRTVGLLKGVHELEIRSTSIHFTRLTVVKIP